MQGHVIPSRATGPQVVPPFADRLLHIVPPPPSRRLPASPLHLQLSCNMSTQAAARAASQAAKAAAPNDRGFLKSGAKRDPELYVCSVPFLSCPLIPLGVAPCPLARAYGC
jgi:hypothetical protein